MPTQIMHLHQLRDAQADPEENISPSYLPDWVAFLFRITVVVAVLLIVLAAIAILTEGSPETHLKEYGIVTAALLILWRQYQLKRWACVLASVAAWGVVALRFSLQWGHLAFPPLSPAMAWGLNVLLVFVALGMTTACIADWRTLERGV